MASHRRELVSLIEQGVIAPDEVSLAVEVAGVTPSPRAWWQLIDRLLLWSGSLALAFAVLFFVAYNWVDMGRLPRFAIVQAALLLAAGIAVWGSARVMVFRVALTSLFVLIGVLLALVGQVYQTGADPWQLFFLWALFSLPLVWVARFDALWVAWLVLLNLAIWLYGRTWGGFSGSVFFSDNVDLWGVVLLNLVAQAIWEWGVQRRGWPGRWAICLLALGSGVTLTLLMVIWASGAALKLMPIVVIYPVWLATLYGIYRRWRLELFMLAGGCVSIITVLTFLLVRLVLWEEGVWQGQWHEGSFLLLAGSVFGMGAVAVAWLKQLNSERVS